MAKTHLEFEARRDSGATQRDETVFTRADAAFSKFHPITDTSTGEKTGTVIPDATIAKGPEAVLDFASERLQNVFFTGKVPAPSL